MKMNAGQVVRQYGKWLHVDGPKSSGDRFDAQSLSAFASSEYCSFSSVAKENVFYGELTIGVAWGFA
ncbi:hypothetical protein REPUB_Repub01dG0203300 [Reevesia pubescens]